MAATTAMNSVPANGGGNIRKKGSSEIPVISDRIAKLLSSQRINDSQEFYTLCLSLSRAIDLAIAKNEDPYKVQDLYLLVKEVCKRHWVSSQLAAVMVLMISVKSACQSGWFMNKDTEELCNLANEISSSFCSGDFKTGPSSSPEIISTIMSRFYPQLRMGQIISFLEVKPGKEALLNDFLLTKNMKISEGEKLRLFVAQIDNLETSQCLITPPQVNFLLNGFVVGGRANVSMDCGPQLPTPVSHMITFGANLLQAVGHFNGNYIVAVAFMSEISALAQVTLPDYQQPPASSVDPDSECIVGPSRISLKCPISFTRIKTPTKGHYCKHLQCFDFDNYMGINSKRPSWRCPLCNQHVCLTDIRIDQDLVKVLKEVGDDVTDVIISSDGSWKAIMGSDDHMQKPRDKTPDFAQDNQRLGSDGLLSNVAGDLFDLIEIDDEICPMDIYKTEDCKNIPIQSNVQNTTAVNNPSEINQAGASHMVDDFFSPMLYSSIGVGTSSSCPSLQTGSASEPAISPALNPVVNNDLIPTSVLQSGLSSPHMLQLQQLQLLNSGYEYGRFQSASRPINRTPVAVQALPARMNTPIPQQRQQSAMNSLHHMELLHASQMAQLMSAQRARAPTQPRFPTPNLRTPYPMSLSQGMTQSSGYPSVGISQVGITRATTPATQQVMRPVQVPRTASPTPGNSDGFRNPMVRDHRGGFTTPSMDFQLDPNWRPSGRMRGSLSGRAYYDAMEQFIIQPNQQGQAARPSPPPNLSPQLHAAMANRVAHSTQEAPFNAT